MRVRVKALPGRIVNTAPKGGRRITHDVKGELIELTPWIHRALNVYGDLEVVPDDVPAQKKKPVRNPPVDDAPELLTPPAD